jgi:hypothetical protein
MTEPAREKTSRELAVPQDGKGARAKKPEERYCAICGADANVYGLAVERFGELFCSDGHAEEFVKEVRAARVQAAANALAVQPPTPEVQPAEASASGAAKQQGWKRYLKLGACCAVPMLALVVLAGGGGALLGGAGAILPLLLVLACPIGMYFAMRGMMKMEQKENPHDKGNEK